MTPSTLRHTAEREVAAAALGAVAVTLFLCFVSGQIVSTIQGLCAFALLAIPWCSFANWKKVGATTVPFFAILAFMHWVYFAVPLFFGARAMPVTLAAISDSTLDRVLLLGVLGVVCLGLGMNTRICNRLPNVLPDLGGSKETRIYLLVVGSACLALGVLGEAYALGEAGRQFIITLQHTVPTVVFAFLARRWLGGTSSLTEKCAVVIFIGIQATIGLSSGWLGSVSFLPLVLTVVYIRERRKLPVSAILIIIPVILFLQTGKDVFRQTYWYGGEEASRVERIQFWLSQSSTRCLKAASSRDFSEVGRLLTQSVDRLSLLEQSANVLEKTPNDVPYQYGRTYSYMAVTFIPRFLWPDKPTVSEANQFYQVSYGLTDPSRLDSVSIAVGFLTEGYINFGVIGIAGVMYSVGLLLGIVQRCSFSFNSGTLFAAIGLALVPDFMSIESQFSQYFSGLLQKIAVVLILVVPLLRRSRSKARVGSLGTTSLGSNCLNRAVQPQ